MQPRWLLTVRGLLRDLRRAKTAKPNESQLELLKITILNAYGIPRLENVGAINQFLGNDTRRRDTEYIVTLFDYNLSADACSRYISSIIYIFDIG